MCIASRPLPTRNWHLKSQILAFPVPGTFMLQGCLLCSLAWKVSDAYFRQLCAVAYQDLKGLNFTYCEMPRLRHSVTIFLDVPEKTPGQ